MFMMCSQENKRDSCIAYGKKLYNSTCDVQMGSTKFLRIILQKSQIK